MFAIGMGAIQGHAPVRLDHGLLLTASALITASVASLVLGAVMSVIIIASKRFNINPDNVSIPIAASLGDITTLALLAGSGDMLYTGASEYFKLSTRGHAGVYVHLMIDSTNMMIGTSAP